MKSHIPIILLIFVMFELSASSVVFFIPNLKDKSLHSHPYQEPSDSLSEPFLYELRESNGLPYLFFRNIRKVVCNTGLCQIAELQLYWNITGTYMGYNLIQNKALTKTNHTDFSSNDYHKLNILLSNPTSSIQYATQSDLTNNELDAITSATSVNYKDVLVENAAYTCYTLWHTVYGHTQQEIEKQLSLRADSNFIKLLSESVNIEHRLLAINLSSSLLKSETILKTITNMLTDSNIIVRQRIIDTLIKTKPLTPFIQQLLATNFKILTPQQQFNYVFTLNSLSHIDDKTLVYLLNEYQHSSLSTSMLNYLLKSVNKQNFSNKIIRKQLYKLRSDKNHYVRSIANDLITRLKK